MEFIQCTHLPFSSTLSPSITLHTKAIHSSNTGKILSTFFTPLYGLKSSSHSFKYALITFCKKKFLCCRQVLQHFFSNNSYCWLMKILILVFSKKYCFSLFFFFIFAKFHDSKAQYS